MPKMKSLLRIEQASQKYKIPEQEIRDLIRKSRLEYYVLDDPEETELIAQDDIATVAADRLVKRDQFSHLEGCPIRVSEAALKYRFHIGTISQWVQDGHIREIGPDPTHKLGRLINEADVAYAAALRDIKGIRPGRSFWP